MAESRTRGLPGSGMLNSDPHEYFTFEDPDPRVKYSSIHKYLWVLITDLTHVQVLANTRGYLRAYKVKSCIFYRVTCVKYSSWILT
jgi:hypothetical protein